MDTKLRIQKAQRTSGRVNANKTLHLGTSYINFRKSKIFKRFLKDRREEMKGTSRKKRRNALSIEKAERRGERRDQTETF